MVLENESLPRRPTTRRTDAAYILPMATFLLLTWAGGHWPSLFPASYAAKTVLAAALLWIFWKEYTPIRWNFWWLGIIVGVVGIVQWVGVEEFLLKYFPNYPKIPAATGDFNPHTYFSTPLKMWSFIAIRWAGATLVVPFMEELFWRDYLWRTIAAPNDFKLAKVGEWDWKAFVVVTLFFASVHPQWITAVIWGVMIACLLLYTRSLGACIIAHGVTNFLLGLYVQWSGKWGYW